jgi:imidazolonepropionase-like amidohydrolase
MSETIILRNAFLIDGNGGEPAPDSTVVVLDGTIREVIPDAKGTKVPKGRAIDLKGKTLMPGLIDAHVHPGNVELTLRETAALPPAVYVHRTTINLETDIDLGFTTLRDAAGLDLGFKTAIDQGLIRGPRLWLSVSPLMQTSGHTDSSRIGRTEPIPRNSIGVFPEICDGQDEVRKATRRALGRGADQIKIFADGEVASQVESDKAKPGQWKFTVEEIRAAVETAEAAGTYVMAHAYSPRAVQNCLAAGVRSIEHGNLMDAETTKMMYEQDVYYVPTLTTYDVLAKEAREGLDGYTIEKLETVLLKGHEALELAYRAGVKIGSGSDIIGPFQHLKGRELALKAEVMTPMEAIISTTRTNAELIGISDRLGTIEPGKWADLIVVDGNPLEDLSLFEHGLERVVLVMRGGRIVKDTMKRP